ncbi:MAG: methyltransferase domain-containing protein [Candidatus Eisenbacteria bacterium]|nr:methyltransferase domain-containing protein [Candidatus Eisenbacteria bacterium]
MRPWHDDDAFWSAVEDVLFPARRRELAEDEARRIVACLGIEPGARILDLCCGVGRHSVQLAKLGFQVTAVDRTESYLKRARASASEEGVEVEFIHEDMRRFRRDEAFDAAVNMFTSFGYFEDPEEDRLVVRNLCGSLRPGGRLMMDLMGKEVLARIFRPRDWHEGDGFIILEERAVSQNWSWIQNRWIVLRGDERRDLSLSHRLYAASELIKLLRDEGFGAARSYGDLAGAPYDHAAKRLVVVAEK